MRQDRLREVRAGHDGTWVPHSGPFAAQTQLAVHWNIDVGIQYLEAWMRGNGCVPIYDLMEDAATTEICRAQVWQWVKQAPG